MKPYIIENKCLAQSMICTAIKNCKTGAVAYIEDEDEPLGGKIVFDYNLCTGCGTCKEVCCGSAIEMK